MSLNLVITKVQIFNKSEKNQQIYCTFNFPQFYIGKVQNISTMHLYDYQPFQKIIVQQKTLKGLNNTIKICIWKYDPHFLIKQLLFEFKDLILLNGRNCHKGEWQFKLYTHTQKLDDLIIQLDKEFNMPKARAKHKSNADLLKKVIQNVSNIPKTINQNQEKLTYQKQNYISQKSHASKSISLIKISLKNSISQLKNISKKYAVQSQTHRQKNDYGISSNSKNQKRLNKSDLKSFYDSCLSRNQQQQCKKMKSVQISQAILSQYGLNISHINQTNNGTCQKIKIKKNEQSNALLHNTQIPIRKILTSETQSNQKRTQFKNKVKKGLIDRNQNRNTLNFLKNPIQQILKAKQKITIITTKHKQTKRVKQQKNKPQTKK